MKKKRVQEKIRSIDLLDFFIDRSIEDVIKDLQKELQINPHYNRICFEESLDIDTCYYSLNLYGEREETDKEYNKRIKEVKELEELEKKRKEKKKQKEYEEYLRLKEKFGD